MADELQDVKIPLEETAAGDMAVVTGDDLVRQRIHLGWRTLPGAFHDLPDWGAGLEEELNRTPRPDSLAQLRNRARRFLDALPLVEDYSITVTREDGEAVALVGRVRYQGREVQLREVPLA